MSKPTTYKFSYPTERGRKDVVDCYMAESREKTVRESGGAAWPTLTRDSRYPSSQSSPGTKGTSQTREESGKIDREPPNKSRKKQETLGLPAKNRAFTTGT
jgi:hypothetical protein